MVIDSVLFKDFEVFIWLDPISMVTVCNVTVAGISPPQKIPPGRLPGSAKYAVDTNLFQLESSILTRVKRATNRNNVATEKRI